VKIALATGPNSSTWCGWPSQQRRWKLKSH